MHVGFFSQASSKNLFWYIPKKVLLFSLRVKFVGIDAQMKLRSQFVQVRKGSGLTQADLAERLGRPQSFVSKYERGERRLDLIEFCDVCRALRVDPVEFLRQFCREGQ